MEKQRTTDVARQAAQLVVLVDELPLPGNAREEALFRKIKQRARKIDRMTKAGRDDKAGRIAQFVKWVAELAVLIWKFRDAAGGNHGQRP